MRPQVATPHASRLMKIKSPLVWKSLGLLGSALIRNWMGTIDFKAAYYDSSFDPAFKEPGKNFVGMFWHEHILGPLYMRRHTGITMLLSKHEDTRIVAEIGALFGYGFVRGSSYRGGAAAVRSMMELGRERKTSTIAIVPDGPRGPYRTMSPGAISLASKLGWPILLLAFGYDRPWRMNSWDRFVVPRPFSRGRAILSAPFFIPPDLDKETQEHYRVRLEALLTTLTDEAERWATSDEPIQDEAKVLPGPKNSIFYYANGF